MNEATVKKQTWWQLLSIQAGGTICLPVIMAGQLVAQKFGWQAALLGMLAGNLFLLGVGYLLASMSAERPRSTVEQAAFYFGNTGRKLFAALMILSMLGWFGIQLNVMSLGLQQLFGMGVPPLLLNVGLGVALSCVMCLGMKAIKWLSYFSAPLLGFTLLYAVFSNSGVLPQAAPLTLSWLGGVSLIIGANIAAVIDLPTFFRHAKSKSDARICIVLLYGLIVPLIEGAGIYLASVASGDSILTALQAGQGLLWAAWVSCFVLLSGWSTNNGNLYSAIASSFSLTKKRGTIARTLALGGIGTFIACLNPLGSMEGILDMIAITIGAMGAVIIGSYLSDTKPSPRLSLISWSAGVAIGLATLLFGLSITAIPAFDAFIAALLTQIALTKRKRYETIDT